MKLKFLGAAGTVTGSKYLLTTKKHQYLVDCGLFQGLKELRKRNWRNLDVEPADIKAVFITHAHIDHSGYLPRLIAMGFDGPIYCSPATYDLLKILLPDSGHLQEEEARYANKKGYSKHKPALPLYTRQQAEKALAYLKVIEFHQPTTFFNDIKVSLSRAGHILGASCIAIEAEGKKIIFSGDVGMDRDPIMFGPEPLPNADYVVLESTYGDRLHAKENMAEELAKIVNDTVERKGAVVIPAFAVGRAQLILHILRVLINKKKIPSLPIFLDSPMAIDATELYYEYHEEHRLNEEETREMCAIATLTRSVEQSKAINDHDGPKVIISASGMASGGRILHHLTHYITDPKNSIVLVGYQAMGTRGRSLQEGATEIKIFGEHYPVKAKIDYLSSLSAHGDYEDLIKWLNQSKLKNPKVFITHGEANASYTFAKKLKQVFNWDVIVPKDGQEHSL